MLPVIKFVVQIAAGVAMGNAAHETMNKVVNAVQKVVEAKKKEGE